MSKLAVIEDIIKKSKLEVEKYSFLKNCVNWNSIEKQLKKNLNLVSFRSKDTPLNFLEALLRPELISGNVIDYKLNIKLLDNCLSVLSNSMSINEIKSFSDKISNLNNTMFWDLGPELFVAYALKQNNHRVKLGFPLKPIKKGFTPPDTDVAIMSGQTEPSWLIDATSPILDEKKDFHLITDSDEAMPMEDDPKAVIDFLIQKIVDKYEKKFLMFEKDFPNTKFAIVLTTTKCDQIMWKLGLIKTPININDSVLNEYKNLGYAVAGRFMNHNGIPILDKVLEYNVV
jgi:hypothetical protein